MALRDLLLRFLAAAGTAGAQAQVLSLGAGYDTAHFQLAREGVAPGKWVELDFLEVRAAGGASRLCALAALHVAIGCEDYGV